MATSETNQENEELELQPVTQTNAAEDIVISDNNIEKYYEFEFDGKIINLKLLSLGDKPKDTTSPDISLTASEALKLPAETPNITDEISAALEKREKIFNLMPDSTNAWLYIKDDPEAENAKGCCMTDNMANKMIAIIIIVLQIGAYVLMTRYLIGNVEDEFEARVRSCYGPNCAQYKLSEEVCMNLTTGGLMSVLLIGFLWADVVNVLSICVDRINKRHKLYWFGASFLILFELMTAIICGFLVGLYSENDFDAIGGAVGILFVHDLDEKVFASMQLFRGTAYAVCKKLTAVSLWIVLSITVAATLACKYEDGSYFNVTSDFQCRDFEYQCTSGTPKCIWAGFKCNGVKDCSDGSDEGDDAGCIYAAGLENGYCPDDNPYMCIEDGSCIEGDKQCNGVLDCPDGSDEGREVQDCSMVNEDRDCDESYGPFNVTENINDTYFQTWSGSFKCKNGQCIKAEYACDGVAGDCVDGTDEYPNFIPVATKDGNYAYLSCPYDRLITCESDEVLCKVDGQCISKAKLCNGVQDCSDGADEPDTCAYSCKDQVLDATQFQCGGNIVGVSPNEFVVEWFDASLLDTVDIQTGGSELDISVFLIAYPNLTIILNETWEDDFGILKDPQYLFNDSTGQCIPIQWRCDGVSDCADGTDEQLCQLFSCPSDQYKCPSTGQCLPFKWLCDGTNDCPDATDEEINVCNKYNGERENIVCDQTVSGTINGDIMTYYSVDASINQGQIDFDGCESTGDIVMAIYTQNWLPIEYLGTCGNGDSSAYVYTPNDYDEPRYILSVGGADSSTTGSYKVTVRCV